MGFVFLADDIWGLGKLFDPDLPTDNFLYKAFEIGQQLPKQFWVNK